MSPPARSGSASVDRPRGLRALLDLLVRLVGVRDGVVPFVVLPLVGLLLALILITAGCGPPN